MKVAVYTSNQPRHIRLVERLAQAFGTVHAVLECSTLFPGEVDDFYRKSEPMQAYFRRVMQAESMVFGEPRLLPAGARVLPVKMGDINRLPMAALQECLDCDVQVVFGASYIKGPLVDALLERGALNIHMGVSPYYRGSGCNFWAVHDGHAGLVGATIHLLSRGLDSGPMLFHSVPARVACDPFELGMRAVEAALADLVQAIGSGALGKLAPQPQDKSLEIRYSRYADFTDEVVEQYLRATPSAQQVGQQLAAADDSRLLRLNSL